MSTLADSISHAKGKLLDTGGMGDISSLSAAIESSQRFIFSQEATDACVKLADSKPSSLLEATRFCRVPFQKMWIEFAPTRKGLSDRADHWPESHKIELPIKIGCLIECLDDSYKRFGVTLAWELRGETLEKVDARARNMSSRERFEAYGPAINICPFGYVVNWHDEWLLGDSVAFVNGTNYRPEIKDVVFLGDKKKYYSIQSEVAAAAEILRRRIPAVSPHSRKRIESLTKRLSHTDREKLQQASAFDWEGEYEGIIAMLCLINSKNCISITQADLHKVNRSRRKIGKIPFISYSNVTINLSRRDASEVRKGGLAASEIRRHIVRGHFKIRKGGVYWWRPFLRGDSAYGEVKRSGYTVVDHPLFQTTEAQP